jgi:peptide synthetase PhsA
VLVVDALPRTRNGKVDRRALAGPAGVVEPAPPVGAAEAGDVEARIAAIWRAVLGTDRVTAADSFFALGGTSISAVKVISQVRRQMGVPVKLSVIFETPTMAALVEAVSRLQATAEEG